MAGYMLDIYKIRRFANGQVTSEKVSKVLKESTVKHAKRVNKNVGYKYVGRYKDMYGNWKYGKKRNSPVYYRHAAKSQAW